MVYGENIILGVEIAVSSFLDSEKNDVPYWCGQENAFPSCSLWCVVCSGSEQEAEETSPACCGCLERGRLTAVRHASQGGFRKYLDIFLNPSLLLQSGMDNGISAVMISIGGDTPPRAELVPTFTHPWSREHPRSAVSIAGLRCAVRQRACWEAGVPPLELTFLLCRARCPCFRLRFLSHSLRLPLNHSAGVEKCGVKNMCPSVSCIYVLVKGGFRNSWCAVPGS